MSSSKYNKRLLNLGCGGTFHKDWLNIDFHDYGGAVLAYDLRLGIPFADDSFEVVYHSHVLEHFTRAGGRDFLRECFRVLRPGGLLRVAVPDLENIARAYIAALEDARAGAEGESATDRHEWMIVELLDQLVRQKSGGEMADLWRRDYLPQESFITARLGQEFMQFRQNLARDTSQKAVTPPNEPLPAVDADFLQGGELHRWMYDEVSLTRLLVSLGFTSVIRQAHNVSLRHDIAAYGLDVAPDGGVRKPDSFFLEALKPAAANQASGPQEPKVAMFSTTDAGGAGIAALRQHKSLLDMGVRSHMYVADLHGRSDAVYACPIVGKRLVQTQSGNVVLSGLFSSRKANATKLARYPERPALLEIFSSPEQCADLGRLPLQEDFDLIHLHWVAGFLDPALSLQALLGRPVVWTLHDMRPFTGGCHYAGGCRKFIEHCGACPQLGSDDPKDLSFEAWSAAKGAFRELDLHIVTPSEWLAQEARQSSLFKDFPVQVIRPAHPLDVFKPLNKSAVRRSMGIKDTDLSLVFSALSLMNKRKGMYFLHECLARLATGPLRDKIHLLLFDNNPPDDFTKMGFAVTALGRVDDPGQVALVYNAADAVLVPSLEDNSPNVICEAAGCGVPVIAFSAGGIPEMIRHKETGWLAPVRDAEALAQGVYWVDEARKDKSLGLRCRAFALEQWNPAAQAREYDKLFQSLCAQRKSVEPSLP